MSYLASSRVSIATGMLPDTVHTQLLITAVFSIGDDGSGRTNHTVTIMAIGGSSAKRKIKGWEVFGALVDRPE